MVKTKILRSYIKNTKRREAFNKMGFNIKNINKRNPEWEWIVSKLPLLKCVECGGELYDMIKLSGLNIKRLVRNKASITCNKGYWKCVNEVCGKFDESIPDYALESQISDKNRIPTHKLQNFDKEFKELEVNGNLTTDLKRMIKPIPIKTIEDLELIPDFATVEYETKTIYTCTFCNKEFVSRTDVFEHILTSEKPKRDVILDEMGEKLFTCQVCGVKLIRYDMKNHANICIDTKRVNEINDKLAKLKEDDPNYKNLRYVYTDELDIVSRRIRTKAIELH